MKYCKKCLQPDTRPSIYFDEHQVCYACIYEDSKKNINFSARMDELQRISVDAKEQAREKGSVYDCVIGVSGGKDSTFQAVTAREKLGLNPLLVNSIPDKITSVGQKNIDNLSRLGFDMIRIKTDPAMDKRLAKHAFLTRGNIFSYAEHSLWASAFIIAEKFDIPLIIQGENPALTLGTCLHTDTSSNACNIILFDTLTSSPIDSLPCNEFPPEKLAFYKIPHANILQEKNIKGVWLQYYMKEWSQVGNADFSIARGLMGRTSESLYDIGRYRRYTGLDSDFIIVNQMIKYLKFGFGFATDEACYDIREGRISREDAVWYVNEYDGKCGKQYIDAFCEYIDIPTAEFWTIVDGYVNKKLFYKNENQRWEPRFTVGEDFTE